MATEIGLSPFTTTSTSGWESSPQPWVRSRLAIANALRGANELTDSEAKSNFTNNLTAA
jgi:hypothetical protein